jgi:hypothetical protein
MLAIPQLVQKVGRKVLFVGTEAYTWQLADFAKAAQNARALGVDTLCVKRADGANKWYQTSGHLALERQTCLSAGVGFLPFMYNYGPKFGNEQIQREAAVAQEMMQVCDGLVCLDMEVEWNNNAAAAQQLCDLLRPSVEKGDVLVTTWADPVEQQWTPVLAALHPIVSAWVPQVYTNWLGTKMQEWQASEGTMLTIFPALDIADLYNYNSPLTLLQTMLSQGHGSYWLWEYQAAIANPTLVHTLFALFGTGHAEPLAQVTTNTSVAKPVQLPAPSHVQPRLQKTYVVQEGDTLVSIAAKLGLSNWFTDLYVPNRALLDTIARQHGFASSNAGALIFPQTVLSYA